MPDIADDVCAVMYEFECQRSKARGRYCFDVVYHEDLNKFLRLIEDKHPNAKQLCQGVIMANEYLDEQQDEDSADFDNLTKH